jgi:hypothetical protein
VKNIPFFRVNEFGLTVQLSDLFRHLFRHTISYLISFPLTMGEGWDGGGRLGLSPPPESSPTMGGGSYFFAQLGYHPYFTEGIVDFSKIQPILFVMNDRSYWKLGERFAKAWNIGNELKGH